MNAVRVILVGCALVLGAPAVAQELDWKNGRLSRLTPLIGSYHHDVVFADAEVAGELAKVVSPETLKIVRRNLEVSAPIEFIAGHLVLSGNRPHHGDTDTASVWLSVYDASAKVVLLHDGELELYAAAERYEYLPLPLRSLIAAPPPTSLYQPPPYVRWIRSGETSGKRRRHPESDRPHHQDSTGPIARDNNDQDVAITEISQ